jgi:hypothetical protein
MNPTRKAHTSELRLNHLLRMVQRFQKPSEICKHVLTCWYNRHNEVGTTMQIMEAMGAVGISYLAIDAAIRTNAWRFCRRKKIRPVAALQIRPV